MSDGSAPVVSVVPNTQSVSYTGPPALQPTVPQTFSGMVKVIGITYTATNPISDESGSIKSLLKSMFLGKGQVWLISLELDITVLRPGGEFLIVSHGDGEEPKTFDQGLSRPVRLWKQFNDASVGSVITERVNFPATVVLQLQPQSEKLSPPYLTIMTRSSPYQIIKDASTTYEDRHPEIHVNYKFTWSCSTWIEVGTSFQ